jgi:nicotinate-nucleotide adenylyltransferase
VNVGILGGTFDPVHNGHLLLAERAREQLQLDEVLFIPAGDPWRKSNRVVTPAEHRLAMLQLAIADNDAFGISGVELARGGPTYTADTIEALASERLDDAFWFILGSDALDDLPNWREPERIVRHAMLAVAARESRDVDEAASRVPKVRDRIVPIVCPRYDVSSTDIRARVAAGQSVRYLVPEPVRLYIEERGLYQGA